MEIRTANWIHMLKENTQSTYREITDSEKKNLVTLVDLLPEILGENNWFLGGGLAIPLAIGKFYRPHSDVDINCDLEKLPEIVANAANSGYELYRRRFSANVGKNKLFAFERIDAKTISETNYRQIKLLKTASKNVAQEYFIDLFPYIRNGNEVTLPAVQFTGLEEEFLSMPLYNSAGKKIPMLHLNRLGKMKEKWHPQKFQTQLDLKMIETYLASAGSKS